ncbi:hypothetical protein [Mycobacterium pseudokansasii]|uniref:hypothetical protein n=1 Tax=Mycobacterium pseudokansasii TaxID=2341080 RepID=UPI0010A97074|nr:hypothetical protein [Mycobacterium pseudokansasii]
MTAVGKAAATPTLISRRAAVAPEWGAITSSSDADGVAAPSLGQESSSRSVRPPTPAVRSRGALIDP